MISQLTFRQFLFRIITSGVLFISSGLAPQYSWAQANRTTPKATVFPSDLFPIDNPVGKRDSGSAFPAPRVISGGRPVGNNGAISEARVPDAFSCPLFENESTSEMFRAIDALTVAMSQLRPNPTCGSTAISRDEVENTTNTLKQAVATITSMAGGATDPATVLSASSATDIEKQLGQVTGALKKIGQNLTNSGFFNPECKNKNSDLWGVITSLNDVILNLSPLFLFGVAMNPALSTYLPWVLGGTMASGSISVADQLISKAPPLNVEDENHRVAFAKNVCQFMKVERRYRLLQDAKNGHIERLLKQIDYSVEQFRSQVAVEKIALQASLQQLDAKIQPSFQFETQILESAKHLRELRNQVSSVRNDAFTCQIGISLAQNKSPQQFPNTIFENLKNSVTFSQNFATYSALNTVASSFSNTNEMNRQQLIALAGKIKDSTFVKSCAQISQDWLTLIDKANQASEVVLRDEKKRLEVSHIESLTGEASKSYIAYKLNEENLKRGETLAAQIKQVAKAAENHWQAVEDSEAAMRMRLLKRTFFGDAPQAIFDRLSPTSTPALMLWFEKTRKEYTGSLVRFDQYMSRNYDLAQALQSKAPIRKTEVVQKNLTYAEARKEILNRGRQERRLQFERIVQLDDLNLTNLPLGSDLQVKACTNLNGAKAHITEARTHFLSARGMCELIAPVLDRVDIDLKIADFCLDDVSANGSVKYSILNQDLQNVIDTDVNKSIDLIKKKLTDLNCPTSVN